MDNPRRRRPSVHRSGAEALDARKVEALETELRALPDLEAPAELWERIRGHLDEDTDNSTSRTRYRQAPMALAASLALLAAAVVLFSFHLSTGDSESGNGEVASVNVVTTPPVHEPRDHADIIETLMEQSRQAEERRRAVLAFYWPSAPERMLREQIGGIDAALNEQMFTETVEPKSREALLRDRVNLMADLTDIERYRQHEFVRQVSF